MTFCVHCSLINFFMLKIFITKCWKKVQQVFFSVCLFIFWYSAKALINKCKHSVHRKVFFTYTLMLTLLHLFWSCLWLCVDCTLIIVFCIYHFLSHEFHLLIHFPLGNFIIQKWLFCFLHYQFLSLLFPMPIQI